MKKIIALLLAAIMVLGLAACASKTETTEASDVKNVVYIVNGNLGDKSFFDSAQAGIDELVKAGRITCKTIELGGTDEDQPKWLSTLYDVSQSGEYDLVICGTYQMPDYLKEVATKYPDQLYLIFDDNTYAGNNSNVVNITYKQNDMGYLVGTFAACMTTDTNLDKINEDAVIGFVGGVDSPVINDFLTGFIEGALAVNPDIKVDTRYTNDYVDTAIAKEFGYSMINDNKCDIIWGVAGNAGNGAAEAALDTGKAWFIGVDSDQELTFSSDLAALTLTSGLKNIGNSIIWIFDQWDAGKTYWGSEVQLGLAEGGVGIVTDKNYDKYASADTKAAVEAAQKGIMDGTGADRFSPNAPLTRAMIVTILYRMAGSPSVSGSSDFTDVAAGKWFAKAVAWAAANGIVNGYGSGLFGPNDPVTREQLAAILYRYTAYCKASTTMNGDNLASFTDLSTVSGYALESMNWAVGEKLLKGANSKLDPKANATRAQVAAIIHRYLER